MRSPDRALAGNLRWTRHGTVWSDFLLQPVPYGFRPLKDKQAARSLHQALFRALPGESLLLGVCAGLDPAAVVERMIAGVDLSSCPEWAAEAEATWDTLAEIGPGQRLYWLSVPLGETKANAKLTEPFKAAFADLKDTLGLPRAAAGSDETARRLDQAGKIAAGIPAPFRPRPATPAQMLWLALHAQQRGLFLDLDAPDADGGDHELAEHLLTPRGGASLPEPLLDEGGQSDLDRRQLRTWNPLERRYVKVVQADRPDNPPASYQSLLVLTDTPSEGTFPGSEFLGRIDECGLDVDWATRLHVLSSDQVSKRNRKALVNLNEQYSQREGELSHGVNQLDRAAADLSDYVAALDADALEVETQATFIFAVGGATPDAVQAQARHLTDFLGSAQYRLTAPLGYQTDLWWAMQPGVPAGKVVREYAQITTSKVLATTVPLASAELGDRRGPLLGLNISTGRPGVVLHDMAGAAHRDVSGSMGVAGELGSGKSTMLKVLAGATVDRGGRVIVTDRTAMGEYEVWAKAVTAATVVNVADPVVSLDPLRLFGPKTGSRVAQSFLTPLLDISPTSVEGVLLSEVLDPTYLADRCVDGLGGLVAHMASPDCVVPGAVDVARTMNVFAKRDFGRVIFDDQLPPLPLDTPAIVIRTHTLELPSRSELEHEHLFKQLRLEKVFGRAMYALIAALARQVCFTDPSVLGAFVVDEAHHLTSSPEGEREIIDFVRDGRKHGAAVMLGSHDPEADFGSATLRGLIPTRILMRHRDRTLAKRGLRWLDLDPDDDDLVELLTENTAPVGPNGIPEHRRGEAFMRDASGSIGRVRVLLPSLPARNQAARTTPPVTSDLP